VHHETAELRDGKTERISYCIQGFFAFSWKKKYSVPFCSAKKGKNVSSSSQHKVV